MEGNNFKLGYELSDYGKLLFEYDDTRGELEMSNQKRKAMLKSPGFYYFAAIIVVLFAWFIASLISSAIKNGFLVSLGLHATGFFALFVMTFIIFLSVGGFWGKFVRWNANKTLNVKSFNNKESDVRDIVDTQRNALIIYEDYIVVTNKGLTDVFDMHMVERVKLSLLKENRKLQYFASFIASNGEMALANVIMPGESYLLIQLKKIFGEKLDIERPIKKAILKTNKSVGEIIVPLMFVFVALVAGAGVIAMHYLVASSIPVFLGVFFIIGGVLGICGTLDFIPFLKDVLVPLLFGAVFLFFPSMVLELVFKSNNQTLTIKSFFAVFNPMGAAVIFLGGIGLMCIVIAVKTVIDYIRYKEKK